MSEPRFGGRLWMQQQMQRRRDELADHENHNREPVIFDGSEEDEPTESENDEQNGRFHGTPAG